MFVEELESNLVIGKITKIALAPDGEWPKVALLILAPGAGTKEHEHLTEVEMLQMISPIAGEITYCGPGDGVHSIPVENFERVYLVKRKPVE